MQVKTVTIQMQALSGVWETVGTDRRRGVWPENVQLAANEAGPSKASFDLRRDPGAQWPDIGAFSPVDIEVGGQLRWTGRVSETPTRDGADTAINVQCEGWQYHLDDDVLQPFYAHTNIADWRDTRTYPTTVLTTFKTNGSVQNDRGAAVIGFANGAPVTLGDSVGITLDVGTISSVKRIVITFENQGVAASTYQLVAFGSDLPSQIVTLGDVAFNADPASAALTQAGTFTTARRFITVYLRRIAGATTETVDRLVRISSIQVYALTAYESGNASALKAPTVLADALDKATLLLSADRTQVDPAGTVTFNFPEFASFDLRTPRETITAANTVHDYRFKIDLLRRPVFLPRPTQAEIEIGSWPGSVFEDASANSGADVYNRAIAQGVQGDGTPIAAERSASQQSGVTLTPVTSPTPDNPSFAANTTSWTASSGTTITRDTTTFDTTPASGRWDRSGGALQFGDFLAETFTGTFLAATTYTLTARVRSSGIPGGLTPIRLAFGTPGVDRVVADVNVDAVFTDVSISWTPSAARTGVQLQLFAISSFYFYVDTLTLSVATPTVVDRRGFRRTKILPASFNLTATLAQQINDVYLANHKTTALKGTVRVSGDTAVRHILTGRNVPPDELLLRTGELLRLSHRTDPDTGAQGRDGRIAEVTYNAATDDATVAIDSTRTTFEALMERLSKVVGTKT